MRQGFMGCELEEDTLCVFDDRGAYSSKLMIGRILKFTPKCAKVQVLNNKNYTWSNYEKTVKLEKVIRIDQEEFKKLIIKKKLNA